MAFQINFICSQKTDEAILTALEDLPKDLHNTYGRIFHKLQHSNAADRRICREIFYLVAAAQRPLTLEELREAFNINPGKTAWDADKLVSDMPRFLSDSCGGLLAVDEEHLTVHFVHRSVKDYLFSEPTNMMYDENMKKADLYMGDIIVTYLNLEWFDRQLAKAKSTMLPRSRSNSSEMLEGSRPRYHIANRFEARLPKSNRRFTFRSIWGGSEASEPTIRENSRPETHSRLKAIPENEVGFKERTRRAHPFLSYAQDYWLFHTKFFKPARVRGYDLWQDLIDGEVETIELPWQDYDNGCIKWIIQNEHWALIDRSLLKFTKEPSHHTAAKLLLEFLEKKATDINDQDINLEAALYVASYLGNKAVVLLLLGKGADTNAVSGRYGTALTAASRRGHEEIARLLSDNGANFNAEAGDYGTALQAPSYHGHEEIARGLLLTNGVRVNADPQTTAGQSTQAISNDSENTVVREIPENLDLEEEESVRDGPNSSASTNDRTLLESHDEAFCDQSLGPLDRMFALSSRLFQAVGLQHPPLEAGKVRVQWKCVSSTIFEPIHQCSSLTSIGLRALDVR